MTASNDPLDDLPTRYSTKPFRFTIKPAHCNKGVPFSRTDCAMALAVLEADPRIDLISVKNTVIKFLRRGERRSHHYFLPPSLQKLAAVNDAGGQPEPGDYELKPSAKAMAKKAAGKVGGSKGGAGKVGFRHISTRHR